MRTGLRRGSAPLVLALTAILVAVCAPAASADTKIPFSYTVNASTHLKKLNQTVTVPPGSFTGKIDLETESLKGAITLPNATFTLKLAGIVPLVTATFHIVETKPVTGTIDFTRQPFPVTATSVFDIQVVSLYAGIVPVNLVGDHCATSKPVKVAMSGVANIGAPATFSGPYTIPKLANCGALTTALNLVIPGPGNTFTAQATPN